MKSDNREFGQSRGDPGTPRDTLPEGLIQGKGRCAVHLVLRAQGRDLVLCITGGQAHVGAVAVAYPGRDGRVATEVLAVGIHKEGPLAAECAAIIAGSGSCACAAVAGIHQDDATAAEIAAIVANARAGTRLLAEGLQPVQGQGGKEECDGET